MTKFVEYRYDECGLDNVILRGLPVVTDDEGDEVVTIPNVNLLHRVLMAAVASKETGLQPKELRFLRTELGFTQAELADRVGKDAQTIGRWERGETPIEKTAEMVIRARALETARVDEFLPMDELARRSVQSAVQLPFLIDASDPNDYRPVKLAA